MTPEELEKIEHDVFNSLDDPEIERTWIMRQQETIRTQEQELKSAFRLARAMHDGERIKQIYGDICKCREALNYLENRLKEI